jgi:hypothetical protein
MGKIARTNAKKKFCANNVIPTYDLRQMASSPILATNVRACPLMAV